MTDQVPPVQTQLEIDPTAGRIAFAAMNFLGRLLGLGRFSEPPVKPKGPVEPWVVDARGKPLAFVERPARGAPRLWSWFPSNKEYRECGPSEGIPAEWVSHCLTGYPWPGSAPPDREMPVTSIVPYDRERHLRLVIRTWRFDLYLEWSKPWQPVSFPLLAPQSLLELGELGPGSWRLREVSEERVTVVGPLGLLAFEPASGRRIWRIPPGPCPGQVEPLGQGRWGWCDDDSREDLSYFWSEDSGWLPVRWQGKRPEMWFFDSIWPGSALKFRADISYDAHIERSCWVDYWFRLQGKAWEPCSEEPAGDWSPLNKDSSGGLKVLQERQGVGVSPEHKLRSYPVLETGCQILDWALLGSDRAAALVRKDGLVYLALWRNADFGPLLCCGRHSPTESAQCEVCKRSINP